MFQTTKNEEGNSHLVRAKDSQLEHGWEIASIKALNAERKLIGS